MARQYSKLSLANIVVNRQFDSESAAKYFGVTLKYILSEQNTNEYKRIVNQLLQRNKQRNRGETVRTSTEITEQEVGAEKEERETAIDNEKQERIDADADLQHQLDNIEVDGEIKRSARGMNPFHDSGMQGRSYGPMIPFNFNGLGGMNPFHDGMTGKPSGDPMRGRLPKKREGAEDILYHLDGQPDLVKDYMWDLIMDRVPELRDADETYNLIFSRLQGYTDPFTPTEKGKLRDIETRATADQTAAEVIAILNALPVGQRLNINWFDGELSIPTNTASWHGQFQLRTAYTSGSIVVDAGNVFIYIADIPATNTTRPGADTARAEHLDAGGSPTDLTNATKSGLTFTFSRRNGESINLTITEAEILLTVQGMTTGQKTSFRAAINAQVAGSYAPLVHNHDSRYYTESESNTRFAPRSGSTIASLIDAVIGTAWRQGVVGPRGLQGIQGIQGIQGVPGPALTKAALLTLLSGLTDTEEGTFRERIGVDKYFNNIHYFKIAPRNNEPLASTYTPNIYIRVLTEVGTASRIIDARNAPAFTIGTITQAGQVAGHRTYVSHYLLFYNS